MLFLTYLIKKGTQTAVGWFFLLLWEKKFQRWVDCPAGGCDVTVTWIYGIRVALCSHPAFFILPSPLSTSPSLSLSLKCASHCTRVILLCSLERFFPPLFVQSVTKHVTAGARTLSLFSSAYSDPFRFIWDFNWRVNHREEKRLLEMPDTERIIFISQSINIYLYLFYLFNPRSNVIQPHHPDHLIIKKIFHIYEWTFLKIRK